MPLDLVQAAIKVPSLDTIEAEITGGLPMSRDRMAAAQANEDFYEGKNSRHFEMREAEKLRDFERRPKRYSRLTRKAIRTLTSLLYAPGPAREFEADQPATAADPAVADMAPPGPADPTQPPKPMTFAEPKAEPTGPAEVWLETAWRANHVNRLMKSADRKATLNDCCAIQAVATGDEARPVRLYPLGAEEFEVFVRDDDPTEPWAVVTMAVMTQNKKKWRRYEAWTAREHRVYETKKVNWSEAFDTAGGTDARYCPHLSGTIDAQRQAGDGLNPYGVLPFTFIWNERPVSRFWGSGIGDMLRECNAEIDREISAIAEHVDVFLNPDLYYINVAAGAKIERKPGQPIHLTPTPGAKAGDNSLSPQAMYLQATLGVQEGWWNAQKYANQTFHELDVPLSAVRDDQQGPTSGLQVEAERGPLLDYTTTRQVDFTEYEEELARLILRVGGYYYGMPELLDAADDLKLSITWTRPASSVRSAESDDHETHDLQEGLASRVTVLMDRGMTREQAEEHLQRVADDKTVEATLFPPPVLALDPNAPVDPNAANPTPDPNQDPNAHV